MLHCDRRLGADRRQIYRATDNVILVLRIELSGILIVIFIVNLKGGSRNPSREVDIVSLVKLGIDHED